jgi:sugar phosphate isomerase/epimerase
MFTTRTGNVPIGIRRGWTEWQKNLPALIGWARDNEFAAIDLGSDVADIAPVIEAGLQVGSVDLLEWGGLMAADAGQRTEAVEKNKSYVTEATAAGAKNFFAVMMPKDPSLSRLENFGYLVESLNALAPTLEATGARIVIEGYPGPGALCCTPESYRATFKECPSSSIGINYDPSHLLRMGIDPIRFLKEFVSRVGHVHGKDALMLADDLYEYGWEQPATFKANPPFGASAWRYTIPGQGMTPWSEVLRILNENSYNGLVCIELEDLNYNGTDDGEKNGFITSAQFLSSC